MEKCPILQLIVGAEQIDSHLDRALALLVDGSSVGDDHLLAEDFGYEEIEGCVGDVVRDNV